MHSGDFFKWNKRFSLMYAMGAWTLFGSLAYYTYTQKDPLGKSKDAPEHDGNITFECLC